MKKAVCLIAAALFTFCLAAPASAETVINSNWTLTRDESIDDDVRITGGTVDLNGHTLTITGSLLQSGGTMNINGGSLLVSGDYRIQNENAGTYSYSNGYLRMVNAADYVIVGGRFVTQSYYAHHTSLTAGTLEIKGDFSQLQGQVQNFLASGTHKVLLSGEGVQTVSFANPSYSCFNILEINKPTLGQLTFTSSLPVARSLITHGYELTDVTFVRNWILTEDTVINISTTTAFRMMAGIDLNGKKLIVNGNSIQSTGMMNINGGRLLISGDYRIQSENAGVYSSSSGNLRMLNASDYVCVGGRFVTQSDYPHYNELAAGTIEVKGDFSQVAGHVQNFLASGTHKVILSGDGTQTVSFTNPSYSYFNILEISKPTLGQLIFASSLPVNTLITNGYSVLTDVCFVRAWTLTEDMVINAVNAAFKVSANINLNGKNLTVNGNLVQSGGQISISGASLAVNGSVLQSGGTIFVNGGTLTITGYYRIQSENAGVYSSSSGNLRMLNASDYVCVGGRFVTQSDYPHYNELAAGTIEVKGDFSQVAGHSQNFLASGTHKVILSGEGQQTVSFISTNNSYFNILEINKPIPGRLFFTSSLPVAGSLITHGYELTNVTFARNWTLSEDTVINLSATTAFRMAVNIDLNGKNLIIKGNLIQANGTMNINGGHLTVADDYRIQYETAGVYTPGYGYLRMTNAADYVSIGGCFVTQSNNGHSGYLTAGTLEVKGDFTQLDGHSQNFLGSGTHKVILSGDGPQIVSFANPTNSYFNDLEIRNYAVNGIQFTNPLNVARNLLTNNIPLPGLTMQTRNWTLVEDVVIEGDLRLLGAVLNLAGRALTVKGNLLHAGGTLIVSSGRLIVRGDYLMQTEAGDASTGYLNMLAAADYVKVYGNFTTKAYYSQSGHLTAGTLEVLGDLTQLSGGSANAFRATGTHCVLLSGAGVQTVGFANYTTSRFNILIITKPLETGYVFTCPTPVWSTLVQQPPLAFIGIEDGGRFVQPVTVDVETSGLTLLRILLTKDGGTPQEIPEGHVIGADGRYILRAEGQDAGGITVSTQVSFAVDLTAPIAAIAGGPFEVFNDGTMVAFDGSGSADQNGIRQYRWTFSDDGSVLEGAVVRRAFPTPGNFTVVLMVEDGFGNSSSAEAQIRVRNKGGTVIEITGAEDGGRYNHDVTVGISVIDGTLTSVRLDGADLGTPTFIIVDDETPLPHILVVEASNGEGYTTTETISFSLDKTKPVASCQDKAGYVGAEVVFNASASHDANGIAEYRWSFTDESEPRSGATTTRIFAAAGTFTGTLTVRDTFDNWSDPKSFAVTVTHRPVEVVFGGVTHGGRYNHDVTVTVMAAYGTLVSLKDQDGNDFPNGGTLTGDHVYRLTAVGRNEGGEEKTFVCGFTVDKTPPVAAIAGGPLVGYNDGKPVALDGSPSTDNLGIAEYKWTISDDLTHHHYGREISHAFTVPGTYTATLVVKDTCGNDSAEASVQVEIRDKGNTEIVIEGVADQGKYRSDLTVAVSVTGGSLLSITLDGQPVGSANFTVSSEQPNPHILSVEATNENEYRTSKTIRFWLDKTLPVARPGADITIYKEESVTFNAAGSTDLNGVTAYAWQFPGEAGERTDVSWTQTFNEVGTYPVTLRVMDACGNWSAPATRTVTVRYRPPVVTVSGVAKNGRYNHDVSINVTVAYGTVGSMTLNDQPLANGAVVSASGKYTLEIMPLDEGGQAGAGSVYEFAIDRTKPVAVIREEGLTAYEGSEMLLDGTLSSDDSGYLTYAWTIAGDPLVYRGASIRKAFAAAGSYQVTLVVTDPFGNASDPARATVEVKSRGSVEITITGVTDGAKYDANVQAEVFVTGGNLTKVLADNKVSPVNPFFHTEQVHEIYVEAVSETGYTASKRVRFSIDKTKPVADAGGDRTAIQDREFVLTGRGTDQNSIAAYKWVLSDGRELSGNKVPVSFASPGVYTAALTVQDDHGNWSEPSVSTINVRCRAPEIKILGIANGQKTNQDVAVNLELNYGTLKEISLNGQAYMPGTLITSEGYYYMDIIVLDQEGMEYPVKIHFAIDRTPPVADAGPDVSGWNDGEPLVFSVHRSTDNLGIRAFTWTFSDSPAVYNTQIVRRSFAAPGTYTVTLVVTDMAGNVSAPDTAVITIRDAGNTVINLTGFVLGQQSTIDIQAGVTVTGGTLTKFMLDGEEISGDTVLVTADGKHVVTAEAASEEGYVRKVSSWFFIDKSLPVPDAGGDKTGYNGQEFIFDGGFSFDPVGIAEYRWTFSDTETPYNTERVTRTFETPGEYLAQLWVRDSFGNWCAEPATARIIIKDRALLAMLDVTVNDGAGHPLSGAIVVLEDGAGNQARYLADGAGRAVMAAEAGSYTLYAWRSGYKSTVAPVSLGTSEARQMSLSLQAGMDIQIVSEAKRLDLEEIKALGIDLNDPANRWICRFEARIVYEGIDEIIQIFCNGSGQAFQPSTDSSGTAFQIFPEVPGGGDGGGDGEPEWQQAVIVIRGTASVLKEFYDLTVYVLNMADPSVTLDEFNLHLNLPAGLALAPIAESCLTSTGGTIRQQTIDVTVPSVPGQGTQKVIWTLRGDKAGSYSPSVDYEGVFNPFAFEMKGSTQPAEPIVITDPRVLQVLIEAPAWVVMGERTDITVSLVNTGDKPFYDAYLVIDEIELDSLRPAYDLSKLHAEKDVLNPGESISLTFQVIPSISGPCVERNVCKIGGNVSFTLLCLPPAPMSVHAEAGDGVVSLFWFSTYEYDTLCHRVKRRAEGETEYKVVGPYVYEQFFDDTTVENFKKYYYIVVALGDLGDGIEGTPSKEVEAYPGVLTASPAPSVYEDPMTISFNVLPGCEVYYTTDGGAPSKGLSKLYNGSLRVNRTMTINAIVVNGNSVSKTFSFLYVINNPFCGAFADYDWTWQAPAGPSHVNRGNELALHLPADQVYDISSGGGVMFLRDVSEPNWSAETRLTLTQYTPGADFSAGIAILAGSTWYTWGFHRGTDLMARNGQGATAASTPSGSVSVYLRVRREGPLYCFEYRLNQADPWIYAGSLRSEAAAAQIGLYAATWGTPVELGLSAEGFAVQALPDPDPNWRFEIPVPGPYYHALGPNSFTIAIPQDRTYDNGAAPRMLRSDMGAGDWTVKAQTTLGSYTGTDFRAGLAIDFGPDDRFFFGLEGPNLVARKFGSGAATWSAAGIGPNVYLRIRKEGEKYFFEYRTLTTNWTTLAEAVYRLPVVSVGAVAETWVTSTQLSIDIQNFSLAKDQTGEAWDWQWESPAGPAHWFIAPDSFALSVPGDKPYDGISVAAPKMARADLGVRDWAVSAQVTLDAYTPGAGFLSGLTAVGADGTNYYWGLRGGTDLVLRAGDQVLHEVQGVGNHVYLGLSKEGARVRFLYRLEPGGDWIEGYVLTVAGETMPRKIGLLTLTWEPTAVRAVFAEVVFARRLGGEWAWHIPKTGPAYRVNPDGSVTLTVPDDRAYNHTTQIDEAPQCYRTDMGEKDWTLEAKVSLDETGNSACETGLMVSFSQYDLVFFGLAGDGNLGATRSSGYGTPRAAYAEKAVYLQLRKQETTYTFSYRATPQGEWIVLGAMEISQAPRWIGFMTRTSAACRVRSTFSDIKLVKTLPEHQLTLRIKNAAANCRVSGATLFVDDLPPIDVDATAPFDVAVNVLALNLPEGAHVLRLTAPGYEDYQVTVDLAADTILPVKMQPLPVSGEGFTLYGEDVEYDEMQQRISVLFYLESQTTDVRLWIKISLVNGSGKVLAFLGQSLYLAAGNLAVLGGQGELTFIGISGAVTVRIEVFPAGATDGEPLVTVDYPLGQG